MSRAPQADTLTGEVIEDDRAQLVPMSSSALAQMTGAEVDIQVSTAHRFPRNLTGSLSLAKSLATINPEVAEACFYALPRGGKTIEGPSVRLAEIMASAWGNMHIAARIVDEGDRHVTAQAYAWDLERNVRVGVEVRRRITGRDGQRFNDDMITVASQAALAVARRNAIFAVIPDAYTEEVYKLAKRTATGQAIPLATKRQSAVAWFGRLGVTPERLCAKLQVGGIDDLTVEHIDTLIGLKTALMDGTTNVESEFPTEVPTTAAPSEVPSPQPQSDRLVDVPTELEGRRRGAK